MSARPDAKAAFGVVGLGVMGRNLALNVAGRGFGVAVWNLEPEWIDRFLAENRGLPLSGQRDLAAFVAALARPRRVLLMIKAGAPVDEMIERLRPLLEPGDVLIDGGNSRYQDTERREAALRARSLEFVGMGISGGEEGARHGPSLMPGGSAAAYAALRPVLEAIAARSDSGPCVTHVGPGGAGHFVKIVHNGIEYADMQLLAEAYDLLARRGGLDAAALAALFARWNEGPLASFLVEITAKVFAVADPETGRPLVELVLDKAGQKGTGRWTVEAALELGVPVPAIAAALDARVLSSLKDERAAASHVLAGPLAPPPSDPAALPRLVHAALLGAKVAAYAQGMSLIRAGSKAFGWEIDLREIARIWKAGCIIRARLLDEIMAAFGDDPELPSLLVAPRFRPVLEDSLPSWREVVCEGARAGIPLPALAAALGHCDAYRSERLPQNLTQAQRDAFGAHTYERLDHPERGALHTDWLGAARPD